MSIFSEDELKRYNRHLILPEIGLDGQRKLKEASVLVVGAGGLGSSALYYLAAAGVGRIGIIDSDVVDQSNLQRQILYGTNDIGKPKVDIAQSRLIDINPFIEIETMQISLNNENAIDLFNKYDVIVDGTDNFPTRYLINDACVLSNKPNVYASIYRFEGQLSVFNYGAGPCYRCFHKTPPDPDLVPSCAEGGVFGVLPGVLGSIQANEAIKIITNTGTVASGRIILYDALALRFRELKLERNSNCEICGDNTKIHKLIDYKKFCGIIEMDKSDLNDNEIDVFALKKRIDNNEKFILLDVREDFEYEICKIDSSILISLSELESRIDELDESEDYVVMCKIGGRSARAVDFLESRGFSNVKNLAGGIKEWISEVDDSLADY